MGAKELREKFEADLKDLQEICMHSKVEEMIHEYAPGHSIGTVRVCVNCEKIMDKLK